MSCCHQLFTMAPPTMDPREARYIRDQGPCAVYTPGPWNNPWSLRPENPQRPVHLCPGHMHMAVKQRSPAKNSEACL